MSSLLAVYGEPAGLIHILAWPPCYLVHSFYIHCIYMYISVVLVGNTPNPYLYPHVTITTTTDPSKATSTHLTTHTIIIIPSQLTTIPPPPTPQTPQKATPTHIAVHTIIIILYLSTTIPPKSVPLYTGYSKNKT